MDFRTDFQKQRSGTNRSFLMLSTPYRLCQKSETLNAFIDLLLNYYRQDGLAL